MIILLSALAVLVAAALLVASFVVEGGIGYLWASVAFAIGSMVLLWAARWVGSSPAPHTRSEPEPLPPTTQTASTSTPIADEVSVSAGVPETDHEPEPDGAVPMFPIAAYDSLWVSQIVPLLGQLDAGELAVVEARERGGRHRSGVLDAIAEMRTVRATGSRPAPVGGNALWSAPDATPAPPPPPPPPATPVDAPDPVAADEPPEATVRVDGTPPTEVFDWSSPTDAEADDDVEEARWDWDAVPRPDADAEADAGPRQVADVAEAPEPVAAVATTGEPALAADGSGPVVVRTFLGRRRSPLTVRRG